MNIKRPNRCHSSKPIVWAVPFALLTYQQFATKRERERELYKNIPPKKKSYHHHSSLTANKKKLYILKPPPETRTTRCEHTRAARPRQKTRARELFFICIWLELERAGAERETHSHRQTHTHIKRPSPKTATDMAEDTTTIKWENIWKPHFSVVNFPLILNIMYHFNSFPPRCHCPLPEFSCQPFSPFLHPSSALLGCFHSMTFIIPPRGRAEFWGSSLRFIFCSLSPSAWWFTLLFLFSLNYSSTPSSRSAGPGNGYAKDKWKENLPNAGAAPETDFQHCRMHCIERSREQ